MVLKNNFKNSITCHKNQICKNINVQYQWRGQGGLGATCPSHFCQDGARDFFKINEKIGVGRAS